MSEDSQDGSLNNYEIFDHSTDLSLLDTMLERVTDMDDCAFEEPKLGEDSPETGSMESVGDSRSAGQLSDLGSSVPPAVKESVCFNHSSEQQITPCEKCPMKEKVRELIYWRNPVWSGIVLIALLAVEFSFLCLSAISLLAYTGFLLLLIVNGLRLYYQHISKTENKMIKELLDREIIIPEDRVADVSRRLTDMLNKQLIVARDIFLLTNLNASIKFGIVLYLMTYVGARFNFLTLCIVATLVAFFVPKFYELYQSEIDRGLKVVGDKAQTVFTQIKNKMDKLPLIGAKKQKAN